MLNKKTLAQILAGSLEDRKTYLVGAYEGFRITVDRMAGSPVSLLVRIYAHCDQETYQAELTGFLNRLKAENKRITEASADTGTVALRITMPNLERNYPKCVNEAVIPVVNFLRSRYFTTGCGCCGSGERPVEIYAIEGGHHLLCLDCARQIHASFEERQEQIRAQKSNAVGGIVGALLGALAGGVLWVLIYKLGYIAGLAGFVCAVLAFKGYEKLGGVLDRKGVFLSLVVMAGVIFFANKLAWSWEAYDALKEYDWTFFECFRYLKDILVECELMGDYIRDLVIGYLLTLVASIGTIVSAFRTSSGSFHMKKEG